MAYRDDLTALSARHDALAAEVAQKTRELDDARRDTERMLMGSVVIKDIPKPSADPAATSPRPVDDTTHAPTTPTTHARG